MPDLVYGKAPGLRTRAVDAAGTLMVFTPAQPKVHWLNLAGWYLYELATGVPGARIASLYADAVARYVSRDDALRQARAYLTDLVHRGVLVARPA
jgi:hypothetical protein